MNENGKRGLILATLVVAALLVVFWSTAQMPPPPMLDRRPVRPIHGDVEMFYTIKIAISTINVALLIFLLASYIDIYRRVKSEFTIGLIIFTMVLLLYALSSNPLVYGIFGFRAFGLGPFAMLPDFFTCIAVTILIYLNFK